MAGFSNALNNVNKDSDDEVINSNTMLVKCCFFVSLITQTYSFFSIVLRKLQLEWKKAVVAFVAVEHYWRPMSFSIVLKRSQLA